MSAAAAEAALVIPTADDLIARAQAETGLRDFGTPTFRDGLEKLLDVMRQEQHRFTQEGVAVATGQFVDRLRSRLEIEDWYDQYPEIEDVQPERPVMITGMPRTGTTALARALSIELTFRLLRSWEQHPPVPPPVLETEASDPRRLAMLARLAERLKNQPEMAAMHLHDVDTTEEDVSLMWLEFRAQAFTLPLFGYHAWWREGDMKAAYAYQRRVIQLLQSRRPPNRWLFKAPHYSFHLEDVSSAYPDAKFLVTHRDPVTTLSSYSSFIRRLQPPGSAERFAPEEFSAHLAGHMARGMEKMIEHRARLGEDRFFDVQHGEFVADPMSVIERIYDFIELPLLPETRARIAEWAERNKPGAHGRHEYDGAQYGIDRAAVRKQFAFYTDHYAIPLEGN